MSFPLFDLSGRRALVTGSFQGIGLAIAAGLAEHGAAIVLNSRDESKLKTAANRLRAAGHAVAVAPFDVTNAEAVQQGVSVIERDIGVIDILVNNAGMQFRTPLEEFPIERWEQLLKTNVSSVSLLKSPSGQGSGLRRLLLTILDSYNRALSAAVI